MESLNEAREIIKLIDIAESIMEKEGDWERKFDLVFGLQIWQKIKEAGYRFDYYDPDTSYEEDVRAYVNALTQFRDDIKGLLPDVTPNESKDLLYKKLVRVAKGMFLMAESVIRQHNNDDILSPDDIHALYELNTELRDTINAIES